MICPLYATDATTQQKAHGCACASPVNPPVSDCAGSITSPACTVPALVWQHLVLQIVSRCGVCDRPLDADNVYGPEGYDLCREHHEKFYQTVYYLVELSEPKPDQGQLRLF